MLSCRFKADDSSVSRCDESLITDAKENDSSTSKPIQTTLWYPVDLYYSTSKLDYDFYNVHISVWVVYIMRLKVPMKMRRWSLMVNFTGSSQGQLCWGWYWPGPVRLTMRVHLRIFMCTLRRTIYTTCLDGETWTLLLMWDREKRICAT